MRLNPMRLTWLTLLASPWLSWAEEAVATVTPITPSATGNGLTAMTVLNVAGSLLIVLALLFTMAWLHKKLAIKLPGSGHIKIVSSLMLGPRERLLVIEVQGKQRVLGVTAHQINMLFELDQPLVEDVAVPDWRSQFQALIQKQKSKS